MARYATRAFISHIPDSRKKENGDALSDRASLQGDRGSVIRFTQHEETRIRSNVALPCEHVSRGHVGWWEMVVVCAWCVRVRCLCVVGGRVWWRWWLSVRVCVCVRVCGVRVCVCV